MNKTIGFLRKARNWFNGFSKRFVCSSSNIRLQISRQLFVFGILSAYPSYPSEFVLMYTFPKYAMNSGSASFQFSANNVYPNSKSSVVSINCKLRISDLIASLFAADLNFYHPFVMNFIILQRFLKWLSIHLRFERRSGTLFTWDAIELSDN